MSTRPYKLVKVVWEDSAMTPGWHRSTSPRPTTSVCETAGYLVERTKARIVIAMNANDDGGYGEAMAIPTACVRSIRRLR